MKVFVSYARADQAFALRLARDLRAAGSDLWLDKLDITAGQEWDDAVEEALETCEAFLVVLSASSVSSRNVKDEISFALEENKRIFPVLLEACKIPFRLRRIQYSEFVEDYEAGLQHVAAAIGLSLTTKTSEASKTRTASAESGPVKTTGEKPGSKAKLSTGLPILRAKPIESLSEEAVKKMLAAKSFFDSSRHTHGNGFSKQLEQIEKNGEKLIFEHNSGLTWQQSGSSKYITYYFYFGELKKVL